MPIEIKELVIKAVVDNTSPGQAGAAEQGAPQKNDEIISACVEQVLEVLKIKRER